MKRILSLFLSFFLICTFFISNISTSFANSKPQITGQYAVLMDYETGKILYEKNSSQKLYPASTTKMWTAYIVLKYASDLNEVIQIKDLPAIEGSSMYLKNGESFTIKQLLDALLVHSANDAAYVLALHIGGSIENFCDMMNKEAKEIGAKNTHFNNPHGLPDENHYTTAYDMAIMTRQAMSNKVFRNIVKTKSIKYEPSEAYPYYRHFTNSNKFLTSNEQINYKGQLVPIKYDIVDGIKTGTTDAAGKCLLSSAVKDNMRLICAVFKSIGNDVYVDSRTLLDYGFDNYYTHTIINKDEYINNKNILFSKQKKLEYAPEYSYKQVLPKGANTSDYTTNIVLNKTKLPIKQGDTVGHLEVINDGKVEHSIDLIAQNDVNSIFGFITENKIVIGIFKGLLIIFTVLISIFILLIIRKKIKRNIKRKNRNIYSNKNKKRK